MIDYLVLLDNELQETYQIYQDLLYTFQNNDLTVLETTLNNELNNIYENINKDT